MSLLAASGAGAGWLLAGCRATRGSRRTATAEAGDGPFLDAVRAGDAAEVRRLASLAPELVDAADAEGRSALVVAYLFGHQEVADALLERSPRIGLVEAVMIPDWERAEELAAEDPGQLDAWHPVGGTALYAAARMGHTGFFKLQFLGADPDGNPRGDGVTPAFGALECEVWADAVRSATSLLSNGADVNAPQNGTSTLLHAAARRGDPYLVRYLIRRGANVAARDGEGRTARDVAERLGKTEAADVLANHARIARDDFTLRYKYDASGAPVVWPDTADVAPALLRSITEPSHFDLARVKELVDPDPRLSFGRSRQDELAVEACGHTGNRAIALYHLQNGVPQSLVTSLSIGDVARARELLTENPGSIHERGPHDFAPMWYTAIGGGGVAAAELLLELGADVNQESQGATALHWAVGRDRRDLVHFLVERGARLDAVSYRRIREGETPLQVAVVRGRDELARDLKALGAA